MEEAKEVQFKLPETVKFPGVLFEGAEDMEEVKEKLTESGFIAIQRKEVIADRLMSTEEINNIREEYGEIAETALPELQSELAELEAKFKREKKTMEGKIASMNTKFKDLVYLAKKGIKDFELVSDCTFRIPVLNHYLYYTWINDRFELALVQEIPNHERNDIFNSVERNKAIFEELGFELPEIDLNEGKENFRRFSGDGYDFEVWTENDFIHVIKMWTEDFVNEHTGEVISENKREREDYSIEDYPYSDLEDGEIEGEEGETDEVSDDPEE